MEMKNLFMANSRDSAVVWNASRGGLGNSTLMRLLRCPQMKITGRYFLIPKEVELIVKV